MFLWAECLSSRPTNSVKALEETVHRPQPHHFFIHRQTSDERALLFSYQLSDSNTSAVEENSVNIVSEKSHTTDYIKAVVCGVLHFVEWLFCVSSKEVTEA